MKTKHNLIPMRLAICLSALCLAGPAVADVVYITARPPLGGAGPNTNLNSNLENVYLEDNLVLGDTSAESTVADAPTTRSGSRYYLYSAPLTNTLSGFSLKPDLAFAGGTYLVQHSFRQFANNTTNGILSVASTNASLSFSETDVFQVSKGNSTWQTLGYLTNNPGVTIPHLEFRYQSGYISAAAPGNRLVVDVFKFSEVIPCLAVPVPTVRGPLATNVPSVTVGGVTSNATAVAVYQDSGGGMIKIGELTNGLVEGVNLVPVTGLVKNAIVSASQTELGQESCIQSSGVIVGGGANPRIRVALSIRETTSTGPVGTPGDSTSTNIHFLGASFRIGSAPGDGTVVYPSNQWQTLAFDADRQAVVGNSANVAGAVNGAGYYETNDVVEARVYAFTNDPVTFVAYYSEVGAASGPVTSNNYFGVDWTWDAVPGAEGYRVLRSTNSMGFNEYQDVYGTTVLNDYGSFGWIAGNTVKPSTIQNGPSVQWNAQFAADLDKTNNIGTPWGILEAIAFAIDDLSDTGPFDLYLDNLQNGVTVFQDFEGFLAGTQDAGFRAPGFSGSTSGNLLGAPNPAPNETVVSNGAADSGTKSVRVRFQWTGTNDSQWLRLTTSGVGNPQVDLADPISFRMLLLPVNATPVAPPAPSLTINIVGGVAVLNWTGTHTLLEATNVAGPYTPVPGPVTNAPYADPLYYLRDAVFFKLVN